MKKIHTVLMKIIAVVLIISLLPLATIDAALDTVVYAMEEVQELPVESEAQDGVIEGMNTEAQEPREESVETEVAEIPENASETVTEILDVEMQEIEDTTVEYEIPQELEESNGMEEIEAEPGNDENLEKLYLSAYWCEEGVELHWGKYQEVTLYEVYRDNVLLVSFPVDTEHVSMYCDTDVQVGKQYSYRVEGKNENGQRIAITEDVNMPQELYIDGYEYRLWRDETVYGVNVSDGSIDLNGYTLTVYSDFVMSEGTLYNSEYHAGTLSCSGNLLLTESEVDYVSVELGGSMVVTGGAIRVESLVLDGEQKQEVEIEGDSWINKIELKNFSEEGVHFASFINCYEIIINGCRFTHEGTGQYGYTLEEDVVFEGDYHLISGMLNLNGHSMTVRGDFYHTKGYIQAGNGNLIIEGNYYLENSEDEEEPYVYYEGGTGYIHVYGEAVLKDGYLCMGYVEGRYCFKIEGDLKICGTQTSAYGGGSFLLAGNKKQVVYYEDDGLMAIYFGVDNHSEEGVFFTDILEYTRVYENGCKVTYFSEEMTYGWTLEEDTIWSGDLCMNGGNLDLNGYSLTITGDFIQMGGTLKTNGGTLCVEGDYRIQSARKQEDNSVVYKRGIGNIEMTSDRDRITVCGDMVLDTEGVIVGEARGILELKGNCDVLYVKNERIDESADFGEIVFVFSGEEAQTFSWELTYSWVYELINRNKQRLSISGSPCIVGRVADETGNVENTSIVKFTESTYFEDGKWNGGIRPGGSSVLLNQDLEIQGTLYADNWLSLNGKTIKAKDAIVNGVYIQKGRMIIAEDITVNGRLTMENSEDYVFCGGDFIVRTKGEGIQDGIVEIQGNLIQPYLYGDEIHGGSYRSKVDMNTTVIFSGTEDQSIQPKGTLTLKNIFNRSTGCLEIMRANWNNQIYVTGKCIDDTGTVCGDSYIRINNIDQIEGSTWTGAILVEEELDLNRDLQIGRLSLANGGRLNGYSLNVGRLSFYNCLYTGGGKIVCSEELNIYGQLITESASETVYVGGRLYISGNESYEETTQGAIIDVKGSVSGYGELSGNFEQYTLILSGTEEQQIYGSIRVNQFINRNTEKVLINGELYVVGECIDETGTVEGLTSKFQMKGVCLEQTTRIKGNKWNGDIVIAEEMELKHDLVVGGNLSIKPGVNLDVKGYEVNVASCVIDGGLYVGSGNVTCDGIVTLGTEGKLILRESEAKLLVNGNFEVNTKYDHSNEIIKGSIEIKGDILTNDIRTKAVLGDITLIFSGTELQSIQKILEIGGIVNRNTYGLGFRDAIVVTNRVSDETGTSNGEIIITNTTFFDYGSWSGSVWVCEPVSLKQNLDVGYEIIVKEGGILRLNGNELHTEDVRVENGTLDVENGILYCEDSFYVERQGILMMRDAKGYLTVGRYFVANSEIDHTGYLTAGVLEVRREFRQGRANSFVASDDHTVVLDASKNKVTVYINYLDAFRFNNVIVNNTYKRYSFSTDLSKISNQVIIDYDVPISYLEAGEITYTTTEFMYGVPAESVVTEYVIYRNGEEIATTTKTTFLDKDLKPGTDYVYEVYPRNDWGILAKSSPRLEITTKTDTEPPVLQGNLRAELRTGSSITLSWNPAKDNVGVEGYTVYRDGVEIATGITDTFYKDTTVEEKRAYRYTITAYDGSGNVSSESNQVESSLGKPEITAIYPEPGKNIKAEVLKLSVHFRDYGNSTGNQVKIEYKNSLGEWVSLTPQLLNQNRYNSTTLYVQYEWDVTHVAGVKGYTLRYTLYDADGNTDVEQVTYFVDHQLPEAPTNVKAIADNGTIKINWEPSASEDCAEYRIYRRNAEEENGSLLATVKGQMNTFYTDKAVVADVEYMYVVTAVDAYAYESEYSEEVTVKADNDELPPVVEEISPRAGSINRTVVISAEASDNKEAVSVVFYCRGEEETEWTELGTVAIVSGKAEYVLDTTQYEDGVYFIGAKAIDAAGNRSEEIFTRRYQMDNTGIAKIILTEHTATSTQVQIKWEDVKDADFAYFQVEQLQGENFVSVGKVSDVLGYTVGNLSPDTFYSFRVVGYDKLGNRGEPSEVCEITTEKDNIKPTIVSVYPIASYYRDSLSLQVNARDNYALGRAVFSYSPDKENFVELASVWVDGKQTANFSHTMSLREFEEGSIYIKFEVYDSAGNKNSLLESGEEIVVEYVIDRTAPSKVEDLVKGSNEGCVELSWTPNEESDVKCYRIYRADGPDGNFYVHKRECNTKNYYDTSVQAGAYYRYKVSAVDIAGNEGECSEEILVIVTADTQAPTVTGITPYDGETIGKQVQIKALALDNASLAWVKAEYQRDGESAWTQVAQVQATGKSQMTNVTWDTIRLSEGVYRLRITAADTAGNISTEQIVTYHVDHTAPEVPQLSAETGHFEITLRIDGEKSSDFAYYEIYRRAVGSGSYTQIATVTEDRFVDTAVLPGDIYFYQVAVYDKCGNMAKTDAVECYADDTDVVAPKAVLPENLVGLTGMEIAFDGMGSSDNVRITQYLWNMGDGTELEGAQPVHIYQNAGNYEVTLQVKDAVGNAAQATTTVTVREKTGRGSSVVKVVDENGAAIPYASIFVSTPVTEGYSLKADSRGLVNVVADSGTYNVAAYANGYLPEDIDIAVSEYEVREYTLTLVKDELIVGELTVHRMELEEMLEAGVDFSDPENYNLFVFKVTLTFAQTPIPVEINYVSGSGGTSYTFSYAGSGQGGSSERTVHIQEITQPEEEDEVPILAYVSTTQHVSWLKDMYEVELGILNAADSRYTIEDAVATLNLPESGVSLAKLVGGQSLTQEMGTIRGQERKTVSWVVKGDKSGRYALTADFEGTLMPFQKKVTARFETENEFEVTTGEGIHIYVMPEKSAYIGEQYYIQFKIVNESEKTFYHFGTSIGAYQEPQKEYTITDEDTGEVYTTTSAPIAVTKGSDLHQSVILEDGQRVVISALLPGETFYGTYKTTFSGEGDPETVYYRLVDSLVEVLAGANLGVKVSVIPIEGHIYRTRFRTEVLPSYYGDPVDITSGYFTEEVEALAVKGASTIGLDMHYSSGLSEYRGELGYGWYHDYEMYLKEENGIIWYYGSPDAKVSFLNKNALQNNLYATKKDGAIRLAEGEEYSFGEYCSLSETMEGYRIVKHKDSTYTMTLPNGIRYGFDAEGRLIKVTDTDGKSVSVSYADRKMTITDDLSGKQVYYNYNSLGFLTSVTDENGREVSLSYDGRGCLTSYTDPIGNKNTYCYDAERRIVEASNAKGTFVLNVYDEEGRVTEQTDARGGRIRFSYEDTTYGMLVTIMDAAGVKKQAAIDANGRTLYVVNENGGKTTYAYDEDGNLLSETDSYGNTTFREYDEKGNIVTLTDSDNRTTTMSYDANGNLTSVTDADGNTSSYIYDERGLMLSATDYNGRVTTYEYDDAGFLVKETVEGLGSVCYTYENGMQRSVTDYMGNTSYMEYDGMGNLVKTTDADGNVTFYEFNAAGQMERSVDNQGNVTSYRYDCNSNLIRLTDGAGNTTIYEYDAAGNQTAINYPDGTKTAYTYDGMGRCIEVCYADGTMESIEYDESGNLTKQTLADGSTVSYKYDLLNRCVEEQDADGNSVLYEYYPNGKLYKETYPDGSSLLYTYNSAGQQVAVTDHTGATISYEYDVKGNVIAERDALGHTKRYTYDVYGRLTAETDANGNTTTYEYDANSNCIKKTNALGVSVHLKYDSRNRLTEVYTETKDGEVYKVSYEYDSLGRVVATTDEEGNVSRMTYDALGNVTTVTDAKGCVRTVSTYDSMGRTATVTDALGITAEYSYDTVGNLLAVTELLNGQADRVTGYEYDSLGRLVGVTDPLDGVTSEVYNEVGQIVSRTDANGGTTTYTYDCMGRLLTELNPIGSKTSYAYNAQGLLSELTNARGQKTSYAYDAAGRVTSLTDELGTVAYEYDANGNILTVTDENGSIERKYDALNRVTEYTDYNGNTVKYAYDEIGNLISLTYPGGEIVRYTYYKNGWLQTVTDAEGRVTSYEYDENGNLTHTTRANGTEEFCTYNEAGLLVEQKDVKGEEVLTHYTYTYDARGNIATVEGTETTEGDLTRLISATMTYDAANRLLTYNGEELRYDADGNMTYGPVNGVMSELVYDCRNRLVSAGGVTYTYDPENTRIAAETDSYREVYVTESVASSLSRILSVTRYEKTAGENGEIELGDGTTTVYVYGNGLIYEYNEDEVLYHHYNNLGSTTKLTDATGAVVETYTFGVYGELLSGDTTLTRFLYNGRCGVSTDDNGLYYMRQRYYNPEIKRFVNQDILTGSIGNSQSLNRYSYVQGNPVSYTDPFGLSPLNGLFSGTMLIHTVCGLLGWIPGPVGAIANAVDGLVYLFVDKDYKNAFYSLGTAVTFGAGKIVAAVGKGSKTALNIQRGCNAIGNGINFLQSAEGTYQTASMMVDKYIVQGQPLSGSTVLEFALLGANMFGAYKSGTYVGNDIADFGGYLKRSWNAKNATNTAKVDTSNGKEPFVKMNLQFFASKSGSDSVDIELKYKDGWTAAQKAEADVKVKALSDATTIKTPANRGGTSASSRYKSAYGKASVPSRYDVDHTIDLQLGGADDILNMNPLDMSVNRSLGVQIKNAIKDYPDGTVFGRFTIK